MSLATLSTLLLMFAPMDAENVQIRNDAQAMPADFNISVNPWGRRGYYYGGYPYYYDSYYGYPYYYDYGYSYYPRYYRRGYRYRNRRW